MTAPSRRPHSGLFDSEHTIGEKDGTKRLRWNRDRQRKEPKLFDEWMNQDKPARDKPPSARLPPADDSTPSPPARTTRAGPTIRTVTPDTRDTGMHHQHASQPDRNVSDPALKSVPPRLADSAIASSSPHGAVDSPTTSSRFRRLTAERRRQSQERVTDSSPRATGNNNNNTNGAAPGSIERDRRDKTQSIDIHTTHPTKSSDGNPPITRLRTRTLDERRWEHNSPMASIDHGRFRAGSLQMPPSPRSTNALVASTVTPRDHAIASSISSYAQLQHHHHHHHHHYHPHQGPESTDRPMSAESNTTTDSLGPGLPRASANRILSMSSTLRGRMSGNVIVRQGVQAPWGQYLCSIQHQTGSLVCELRTGTMTMLMEDLSTCHIGTDIDGDTPYLKLTDGVSGDEIHLRTHSRAEFEAWLAALLFWQPRDTWRALGIDERPGSEMSMPTSTMTERARWPTSPSASDRPESNTSERQQSMAPGQASRENPVIKIGRMIYWSTMADYGEQAPPGTSLGHPSASRPRPSRMQSMSSRRWKRINGQLRENGELKLHAEADNSLITVIQLSHLSRCAVQRLDPTVLENDFSIAIYPQYTASYAETQQELVRPIFLSLENRVLHEVWFVLLRAFTMPSIYGPRLDPNEAAVANGAAPAQDLESMIATSTTYTFRVERNLHIRVVEARMLPPSAIGASEHDSNGTRAREAKNPEKVGYYADILLDNETRGKTVVKYDGLNPLWGETFEFHDLPPVLNSASIIVKRRPLDQSHAKDNHDNQIGSDPYGLAGEQQGGFVAYSFDVQCGKVEIQLDQLEPGKELEKRWTLFNMYGQKVGEVLIKVRAVEDIILMARDYSLLGHVLQRFTNGLTLQIAQMIPGELKRLCDCLLDIFQVSGCATDWLMALVEDEIDGVHKESSITRLRYTRRINSNDSNDPHGTGNQTDREAFVRDMNKNATLEANLLFRGNTLLTKSLDIHMRRVGKEYLEETLAAKIKEINDKDPDCEVDPNRVQSPADLDRNWRRLLIFTQDVWKAIVAAKSRCPVELRLIFRHIRACAEDRYGDFLRSVSYSSVSGFVFLRFFCPAVLNPKLFGLVKDDLKPRARRTFTLIAKSLQTLANMASFGTKEPWMEPMNAFLLQHRDGFKMFIDDICYVPAPVSTGPRSASNTSPTYPSDVVSTESHMSYTTPMTIMQRLPPSSREGFPSLPYLIDRPKAFAELIHLWLEATAALSDSSEPNTLPGKTRHDVLNAINSSEGDLKVFHQLCEALNARTQECLIRAERAERPQSTTSFQWEDVIDQLKSTHLRESGSLAGPLLDQNIPRPSTEPRAQPAPTSEPKKQRPERPVRHYSDAEIDDDNHATRFFDPSTPGSSKGIPFDTSDRNTPTSRDRTGSVSMPSSFKAGAQFPPQYTFGGTEPLRNPRNWSRPTGASSPVLTGSASLSAASSIVSSSDNEPTALPSWERELRHREKRERARLRIQQQVAEAAVKEKEKERVDKERKQSKVGTKLGSALRKKKTEREREQPLAAGAASRGLSSAAGLRDETFEEDLPRVRGGEWMFR